MFLFPDKEVTVPVTPTSNIISIDLEDTRQEIIGFGGCNSVFRGASNFPKENDMQTAYGTGDNELGLSIFRVSIPTDPSRWSAIAEVAKFAQGRGAIVFASPWDAPEDMLNPDLEEKRILPSKYGDYVDHLNSFDDFMKNNGINLHAISIQNEPDIGEWTKWTTTEVADFVKNHAGDINNKVITAESYNFNRDYYNSILSDPEAVNNFDIVGGHIYGNGLGEFPLAEQKGKEIWMTEYLLNEFTDNITENDWTALTDQQKWDQSMEMLNTVHEAMTSNWNVYMWWYLKRYYSFIGDGLEGSVEGEILKRGYAFSHFSKFIRPGYTRVGLEIESGTGLLVTAYEGDGNVVVNIINPTASNATSKISVKDRNITSAKSYTTSLNSNRLSKDLSVENNAITPGIFSSSITTIIFEF